MNIEYIIVSERVGKPGASFTPAEGVNVEALLAGGFIARKTSRQNKTTTTTEEVTEDNGN
jgi:hypothetical protein